MKVCKECGTCLEDSSPITADWLREVWGFEKAEWSKIAYENGHWSMVKVNDDCWHYEDDNFEWPHDLHTRQQFCDLARCLGIPRKQPKPEPEGCTCLSSPNMLYAPCSYCDKQRKDGAK